MSWMTLFKKQLFDLEVKVPQRSLWYATHRLMVIHPHTIDLSRKTKMLWPGQENTIQKTIIWPWGQSPTKVITVCGTPPYGHAPTIPNIIDLSGKTKKLWSGQASLRKSGSGRKNQTKTICLPSFEGET